MQSKHAADEQGEAPSRISPRDYAAFIGQIQLKDVWLQKARVVNFHGPRAPEESTLGFRSEAEWHSRDGGFTILHHYSVKLESAEDTLAEIDATFGLDFDSRQPITPEIFEIFEDVNLGVNTWPFLREFVSTTMGRMGWTPFTLPALKRGVQESARPAQRRHPSTGRTRRKPPAATNVP